MKPVFDRPTGGAETSHWHKDSSLARKGFRDLAYLPKGRCAWNMTLAAAAYAARRLVRERIEQRPALTADLNLWAAMHGAPPSARYNDLGSDALVLWHGTSAQRAEKIRTRGLMHKRGVWATTDPLIAHGYTRGRSQAFQAGSAMICLVISKNEWDGRASLDSETIARFHESVPPECVEYILWSDRIEFRGQRKARSPGSWGAARFKKHRGRWVPQSKPPVRLDARRSYSDLDEWLTLSIRRIGEALGTFAAVEVFSCLYATIDPWDALTHRQVFDAIDRLCGRGGRIVGKIRLFSLADRDG